MESNINIPSTTQSPTTQSGEENKIENFISETESTIYSPKLVMLGNNCDSGSNNCFLIKVINL